MAIDHYSCDDYRKARLAAASDQPCLVPTRRGFLVGLGLAALGAGLPSSALSQVTIDPSRRREGGNVLVSIFLRGGADGLNIVVPHGEDAYYRLRPTLGIGKSQLLDLDGFYGLHGSLARLQPLYQSGEMAIVHAVGSGDQTRSHFEAMNAMERGLGAGSGGVPSGWVARLLAATEPISASPMRAVAIGATVPDSLRGATHAVTIESLDQFRLEAREADRLHGALVDLYSRSKDEVSQSGARTLEVLTTLKKLEGATAGAGKYPDTDLGRALSQVATLVRSDIGLEVAVLDKGGWDTHVAQELLLSSLLTDLSASVAAFHDDLGVDRERVTLMIQTEFGRRAGENSGAGTDHGRASVLFLLGAGVKGGKVYGDWPGLEEHQLEGPGDLRVTTDYRDVLGEVLTSRCALREPSNVFPGLEHSPQGIVSR